jgi:uncharacterized protein (DUF2252 family)
VNDFDEAVVGPLRHDVLRLATSFLLAARDLKADAKRTLAVGSRLIDAHSMHLFERDSPMPAEPPPVRGLLKRVGERTRATFLHDRTEGEGAKRVFIRDGRYRDVARSVQKAACEGFGRYLARLPEEVRPTDEQAEVLDVAFRVAGTGSLGVLRLAILIAGKSGKNGAWVFEMKQQEDPAARVLIGEQDVAPAKRVARAVRALLQHPPRMLGTAKVDGKSMLVRRLAPQEDKLKAERDVKGDTIEDLAEYCGALLGSAHRRGTQKLSHRPWSDGDRVQILESAIRLAALHDAVWLSYFLQADLVPRTLRDTGSTN